MVRIYIIMAMALEIGKKGVLDIKIEDIKKALEEDIRAKYTDKNFIYEKPNRIQICVHKVVDNYVSQITTSEVEELSNKLGITKIMQIEQEYEDKFGPLTEKDPIAKLRQLLYWYFEQEIKPKLEDLEEDLEGAAWPWQYNHGKAYPLKKMLEEL